MATHELIVLPTGTSWSEDGGSWTTNADIHAGLSGSAEYRTRMAFPTSLFTSIGAGILQGMSIQLRRLDSYSSKVIKFGFSTGNDWGSSLMNSVNKTVSSGIATKTVDITEIMDALKSVIGGTLYLHMRHGSGDNSYAKFASVTNGTTSYRPRLILTYADATVEVVVGGAWVDCVVNIYKDGKWVKCIPYNRVNGLWVQAGG